MIRALVIASLLVGCALEGDDINNQIDLGLPSHFPAPRIPDDNPLTSESVALGRHLFYDTRLSGNGELSCSHCHQQQFAFADEVALSVGATGELGVLNAPALTNVIYMRPLTWAHGTVVEIEEQLKGPMFGETPLEMGMAGAEEVILARLSAEPLYGVLFEQAFPGEQPNLDMVRFALASFVRSLVSYNAPFDQFLKGDMLAISDSARRGSELFFSPRLGCDGCHAGFGFTTAAISDAASSQRSPFHNIGLYNLNADGAYPSSATGLIAESGIERDMGRFRVPSLRNVALTAPYGHDGSVATLEDFIRIYERGGRKIESGTLEGDGKQNPWRSESLKQFELSDLERSDLIAFLESLSDPTIATNPEFANPWDTSRSD